LSCISVKSPTSGATHQKGQRLRRGVKGPGIEENAREGKVLRKRKKEEGKTGIDGKLA
jgi:hypothetical protein